MIPEGAGEETASALRDRPRPSPPPAIPHNQRVATLISTPCSHREGAFQKLSQGAFPPLKSQESPAKSCSGVRRLPGQAAGPRSHRCQNWNGETSKGKEAQRHE